MKRLLIVLFFLCLPSLSLAASVLANWNRVTEDVNDQPENISHYVLYYGETARPGNVTHPSDPGFSYDQNTNVGNINQVTQDGLTVGQTYYFSVCAVDVSGNVSAYSAEVSITIPEEDGGPADGGTDAGTDAGFDAGGDSTTPADDEETDGGTQGPEVKGGCSCASEPGTGAAWWLVLLPMLLWRGRRESS